MEKIPIRQIDAARAKTNLSGSFRIREVRDLLAGKDMHQELHRHDFLFILALQKGKGVHEIDFTPYPIADHSVFIMRPGQVHQLTLKAGSTGFLMEFNRDFYHPHDKPSARLLRRVGSINHCQTDADAFRKLMALLTNIYHEYTDEKENYQEVIKGSLAIFFIELLRNRQHRTGTSDPGNTYTQDRLEDFLELLETHVYSKKHVSEYAEMLHLSPFQLNAITKKTLGKTGSELINEYIILESKRHLLVTSNQINQIAYHLGYEDVSYFIRFFRKHTGYSPETFRHNFK